LTALEIDELAPAFDLALYGRGEDGTSEVGRYAQEQRGKVSATEQRVLTAMGAARFSIFRVIEPHPTAGVRLLDLSCGEEVWMVDRGLGISAAPGTELAMRLFRPDDFWMTTGVTIVVNGDDIWQLLERHGLAVRNGGIVEVKDRDRLARTVYRLAMDPDTLDDMKGQVGSLQHVHSYDLVG
jgi:hypothetical protein